jgi:hypothetical protein
MEIPVRMDHLVTFVVCHVTSLNLPLQSYCALQVQRLFISNKNPVKDFCWWDLGGVCRCCRRRRAVVDGSLDLSARATSFFI